jgi:glycosyltransferase involved in cell wall biosynthesis
MRALRVVGQRPDTSQRSFGLLSTYPPTACGIATFTAALAGGLERSGAKDVAVVRINDGSGPAPEDRVVTELRNGSAVSLAATAAKLNEFDVAIVQHEYGIYGGRDGAEVIEILQLLDVPSIVIAHTVLRTPTTNQKFVLEEIASAATLVVVMTESARVRLCADYDVDPDKVALIPHGASTEPGPRPTRADRAPYLLTWGLMGPGKGIERMIDALASLGGSVPPVHYVIAGRTHPKVLAADGEQYRQMLERRAWHNGTAARITFDSSYRDLASLTALVRGATAIVLPYDSDDQATSGVLVDAVAAGRPVIATAFPHAMELLGSGAGIIVDHTDHEGLVAALRCVLTDPERAASMAAEAARLAPDLSWDAVAARYLHLAESVLPRVADAVAM